MELLKEAESQDDRIKGGAGETISTVTGKTSVKDFGLNSAAPHSRAEQGDMKWGKEDARSKN